MRAKSIAAAAFVALAATTIHARRAEAPQAGFVASTDRTYDQLTGDAMAVMHRDMHAAPHSGDPDRDFVTMMIPHHQGAVDMARALLLYGRDEQTRRLAQEIIADQQNEIELMRRWLAKHPEARR